jgi:ATP-binding protein involved in chromosome partitioning
MAATTDADGTAERVETALAEADVGRDDLSAPLVALDGVSVRVRDGVAQLAVTLPVPAEDVRERLDTDLRATAGAVDGVSGVEVSWRPAAADPGDRVELIPDVKNVVAVSSGKGGVGKSTVATNVAVALADTGASVGLLDADVYGPNAPAMLGVSESTPRTTHTDNIVPWEAHGVSVMSMGFVAGEDDPVIWRGPMVDDAIEQLFRDVQWGELDYLIVDLPPGTGDAQLSLVQHLPVTGAVVVTTPQPVAVDDARRGLRQFERYGVPVLGLAENMTSFECPDCEHVTDLFGAGGGDDLAAEFDVPVLGQVPLDPAVGELTADEDDDRGVAIPLVGRVALPRTREEREQEGRRPPVALREDGGDPRRALRRLATGVAARVNVVVAGEGEVER